MPLSEVTNLDEDELWAYSQAVSDRRKQEAWNGLHELLAEQITLLHAIHIELARGVPMVQVKKQRKGEKPFRVKRPDWIAPDEPDEVVVTSFRGLRQYLN